MSDQKIEHCGSDENNGIARNHQDREPNGKTAILWIDFAPVTNAQGDDPAQKQTLIGNRIEDYSERAALIIAAGDITIETITDGGDEEN